MSHCPHKLGSDCQFCAEDEAEMVLARAEAAEADRLSRRDHVAVAAMQGILACPDFSSSPDGSNHHLLANIAYRIADAMERERGRK